MPQIGCELLEARNQNLSIKHSLTNFGPILDNQSLKPVVEAIYL